MKMWKLWMPAGGGALLGAAMMMTLAGCQTASPRGEVSGTAPAAAVAVPAKSATPAVARPTIRVNAGADDAMTDSQGVRWAGDTGFDGGSTEVRSDLPITGTATPELYRSEHYGMDSYSVKVPNGRYLLKLHFSEDYDGITSPEDRVFTYAVKDGTAKEGKVIKEVKNFSPWKAAGAQYKAYVDTVPVDVTAGQITIVFTSQVENPQINALEILPQ